MHQYKGKLILHTGSMFSGKTSSLWKDLNRFEIAKYETVVFKPKFDNRYADKEIVTHDNNKMRAIPVENIDEIIEYMKTSTASIIGIDEVQFIKGDINKIVETLNLFLENEFTVVLAGLDMDFKGVPFGPIPALCAVADEVTKVHAICVKCGALAYVSHRLIADNRRVMLGEQQEYEPLCRECYKRATQNEANNKE